MVEQRKSRRFELRLPLEVTRAGPTPFHRAGETRNLSVGGVLFSMDASVALGQVVEYVITLPVIRTGGSAVRLHCVGRVIRNESSGAAATLERYEFMFD